MLFRSETQRKELKFSNLNVLNATPLEMVKATDKDLTCTDSGENPPVKLKDTDIPKLTKKSDSFGDKRLLTSTSRTQRRLSLEPR